MTPQQIAASEARKWQQEALYGRPKRLWPIRRVIGVLAFLMALVAIEEVAAAYLTSGIARGVIW